MQNKFCFISPCFNASKTLRQMLCSLAGQSYSNWKLILIDDVSDESNWKNCSELLSAFDQMLGKGPSGDAYINVVRNTEKKWEVANVLKGISMCNDDDIICRIDADDWLCDLDALAMVNTAYMQSNADIIWSAHRWGLSDKNISGPLPDGVDVYAYPWVTSHFKTFRKHLINGVPYENFLNMNNELVKRAGDQCVYLPCLHKANTRRFLPRVLYHYSIDEQGGAVYQTDDAKFQKQEADFLRNRGFVSQGQPWEKFFV